METFLDIATKRLDKNTKKQTEIMQLFIKTLKFYKFIPKKGTLNECTPGQFFEYWAPFTNDFKDIWKKEITILNNEM